MKQVSVLLLFFVSLSIKGFSQTREIDTLRLALKSEKEDSNKVNSLNLLSGNFSKVSLYDSSIVYANLAIEIAGKVGFEKGLAEAYNNLANSTAFRSDYVKALEYANKSLEINQKIGNKKGESTNFNTLGLIYMGTGNFPKSLDCFLSGLTICRETGNKNVSSLLGNIGLIYYGQKNFAKALEYDSMALAASKERGYKIGIAAIGGNIGIIYAETGDYKKAMEYYTNSLAINQQVGYKTGIAENYSNIGDIYKNQQNYPDALNYELKALLLFEGIGKGNDIAYTFCTVGNIYTKLKKYNVAKEYLDSSLVLSKQMSSDDNLKDVYYAYYKMDSINGDYKAGLEDYKNYVIYHDKMASEATIKKTTQAEMNFDFTRRSDSTRAAQDKLNDAAEKEKQKQAVIRNVLIGGISFTFIASGIFYLQRRRISKDRERLKETNAVKDKLFSIISHDLRSPLNLLNGILGLFKRGKITPENSEMLSQNLESSMHSTIDLVDNLLSWSSSQMKGFKIKPEKLKPDEIISNIINLYSHAAEKKGITIQTDLKEGVEIDTDRNTMKLVLRNLLNNAIKFSHGGGKINISTFNKNGYSGFSVKDEGIGISQAQLKTIFKLGNNQKIREGTDNEPGSGLGLILCDELITRSGGNLKVESEEGKGTTILASFPV